MKFFKTSKPCKRLFSGWNWTPKILFNSKEATQDESWEKVEKLLWKLSLDLIP